MPKAVDRNALIVQDSCDIIERVNRGDKLQVTFLYIKLPTAMYFRVLLCNSQVFLNFCTPILASDLPHT